jgi:hypothetical protein
MLPFIMQKCLIFSLSVEEKKLYKKDKWNSNYYENEQILHELSWFYKKLEKNQWIWSYCGWDTPISNFNFRLKRKNDGENEPCGPAKQLNQPGAATWSRSSIDLRM